MRELAVALAAQGNRVLIWDRPNCGESDVCFEGTSESAMQADALAALLEHLDMVPAVIAGGSGGARVSLLTASRHRADAAGLAIWWISGGVFGLLSLAMHYCGGSLAAAWTEGMEAVAALPDWTEVQERNPANRQRFLAQDRDEFISAMERWMLAYCPRDDEPVPGLPLADARRAGHPDSRLPQRRQRRPPHPCDLGGARRDLAPGAARGAAVGRPRVARTPGIERRGPLRRAGPSWPPR